MENFNFDTELTISMDKYELLMESLDKANSLTQVILAMPTSNLEDVSASTLYHFLMAIDELTYKASQLCSSFKLKASVHENQCVRL